MFNAKYSNLVGSKTDGRGDFYIGVDLGQKHDQSVIVLLERVGETLILRYVKRFKLGTEYQAVRDHLKFLQSKFNIRALVIDQTGVGEVFVEDCQKQGLKPVTGLILTLPTKQEVMVNLKQLMEQGRFHMTFDLDLVNEMNVESAELTQTGKTKFSHRSGTHDDRLWALALAAYGARNRRTVIDYTTYLSVRPGEGPRPVVDWTKKDNIPPGIWATCMFCPRRRKPGTDCPCGRTKADGTQIAPVPTGPPANTIRCSPQMVGWFCQR